MDLAGWDAIEQFPFKTSKEIIGATIAYKFDAKDGGWARGTVKSLAKSGENAGMYGIETAFAERAPCSPLRDTQMAFFTQEFVYPVRL